MNQWERPNNNNFAESGILFVSPESEVQLLSKIFDSFLQKNAADPDKFMGREGGELLITELAELTFSTLEKEYLIVDRKNTTEVERAKVSQMILDLLENVKKHLEKKANAISIVGEIPGLDEEMVANVDPGSILEVEGIISNLAGQIALRQITGNVSGPTDNEVRNLAALLGTGISRKVLDSLLNYLLANNSRLLAMSKGTVLLTQDSEPRGQLLLGFSGEVNQTPEWVLTQRQEIEQALTEAERRKSKANPPDVIPLGHAGTIYDLLSGALDRIEREAKEMMLGSEAVDEKVSDKETAGIRYKDYILGSFNLDRYPKILAIFSTKNPTNLFEGNEEQKGKAFQVLNKLILQYLINNKRLVSKILNCRLEDVDKTGILKLLEKLNSKLTQVLSKSIGEKDAILVNFLEQSGLNNKEKFFALLNYLLWDDLQKDKEFMRTRSQYIDSIASNAVVDLAIDTSTLKKLESIFYQNPYKSEFAKTIAGKVIGDNTRVSGFIEVLMKFRGKSGWKRNHILLLSKLKDGTNFNFTYSEQRINPMEYVFSLVAEYLRRNLRLKYRGNGQEKVKNIVRQFLEQHVLIDLRNIKL